MEPYLIATIDDPRFTTQTGVAIRIVETINREHDGVIGIRTTFGDPTSFKEVPVLSLKNVHKQKKTIYLHHAIAKGITHFPEDMLRYDNCQVDVLSDQTFVDNYCPKIDTHLFRQQTEIYVVKVSTNKKPQWTVDRWASFGWRITPTSTKEFKKVLTS